MTYGRGKLFGYDVSMGNEKPQKCDPKAIRRIVDRIELCEEMLSKAHQWMVDDGFEEIQFSHHVSMERCLPHVEKFCQQALNALNVARANAGMFKATPQEKETTIVPILYDNAGETGLESAVADGMGKKRPKKKPAKKKPTTKKE